MQNAQFWIVYEAFYPIAAFADAKNVPEPGIASGDWDCPHRRGSTATCDGCAGSLMSSAASGSAVGSQQPSFWASEA